MSHARVLLVAVVLAATSSLPSCTVPPPASAPAGGAVRVVAVVDGDTIDVQTEAGRDRVRLLGINTPEIGRSGKPDDCYAQEARDELDAIAYGKTVQLRADDSQGDRDKYGRLLRHVSVDGQNVALTLIEDGAAREYTYRSAYDGQAEYRAAEGAARAAHVGLWGSCP